jgi:radical SAM protein with 4Fe4S-binding SPASM domain
MEADGIHARHLIVYHEKDRDESLLGAGHSIHSYLTEAYAILDAHGVAKDCPPLIGKVVEESSASAQFGDENDAPTLRPDDRCLYFHRNAVVHHNGDVFTCSAPFAAKVGDLNESACFREIWNGAAMQAVRNDFGTEREWSQCRSCWHRELKWYSQRQEKSRERVFDVAKESLYSIKAWDFRENIRQAGSPGS